VDHRRQGVLGEQRQVDGLEEALQHQDRLGDAGDAQPRRLLEVEHREAVGGLERARRALQAMAVGVRLEHRPELGAAGVGLGDEQIVRERAGRDRGADGARHRAL